MGGKGRDERRDERREGGMGGKGQENRKAPSRSLRSSTVTGGHVYYLRDLDPGDIDLDLDHPQEPPQTP